MPFVPQELIELILADALAFYRRFQDDSNGSSMATLSSFALVSTRWRHLVNTRRFASIFVGSNVPTRRIDRLAALMCTSLWPQHEGVAQHCREFVLSPDNPARLAAQGLHEYIERNIKISVILRVIFRGDMRTGNAQKKIHYIFRLLGPVYSDGSIGPRFIFAGLSATVILGLQVLISNPNLTRLMISNMVSVPPFLCSPNVHELCLHNVEFLNMSHGIDLTSGWPLPNLRVLKLDGVSIFVVETILQLCDHLPSLDHLILCHRPGQNEALFLSLYQLGKHVKELTIEYVSITRRDEHGPEEQVDFTQFGTLTTLRLMLDIKEHIVVMQGGFVNSLRYSLFKQLYNYLPPMLPRVLHLCVRGHVLWDSHTLDYPDTSLDTLSSSSIGYERLAEELRHKLLLLPSSEVKIHLHIEVRPIKHAHRHSLKFLRQFSEYASKYLESRLDYLSQIERVTLGVFVHTLDVPEDSDDESSDPDDYSMDSEDWEAHHECFGSSTSGSEMEIDDEDNDAEDNGEAVDKDDDDTEEDGEAADEKSAAMDL